MPSQTHLLTSRACLCKCGPQKIVSWPECDNLGCVAARARIPMRCSIEKLLSSRLASSLLAKPARSIRLRNLALLRLVQRNALQNVGARVFSLCLPMFKVLRGLSPLFCCQPLRTNCQSSLLQALKLLRNLLPLVRKLMCLSRLRPEVGYRET
jgi:hypothetical protein